MSLIENPDASSRPSQIEITTKTGGHLVVYDPVIRGDSLRGFVDEDRNNPTALAVQDIQTARLRQFSGARTAALVLGIAAAVVGTAFILAVIVWSETSY